jgi:hypothetical protein
MLLGILTYLLVLLTLCSGLKLIKLNLKSHRRLGISALISASIHAALVIYSNFL